MGLRRAFALVGLAGLTAGALLFFSDQGRDIRRGGDSVEDWLLTHGAAHKIGSWAAGQCVDTTLNVRKLTEDQHDGLGGMFSDLEYDAFEGPANGMTAEITDFGARDDGNVLLGIGALGTAGDVGQMNVKVCRGEGGTGNRFTIVATAAGANAGMTLIARTPEAPAPVPS